MLDIRIESEDVPLAHLPLYRRLMTLAARSAAMGVLSDQRITRLDAATLKRLLRDLQRSGLVQSSTIDLAPLLQGGVSGLDDGTAHAMEAEIGKLVDVLDESPAPASEWATMREIFGDEALAGLVGVAEPSLRRYATGSRETPQTVAERLHWLAMVVADLSGAYNEFGMRRWFDRPRPQLDGRSPRRLLGSHWRVDDRAATRVRALAAALSGAHPLAA